MRRRIGPLQRWVRHLGKLVVAEAVVVVLAPALAYLIAYELLRGYATFFKMPLALIKVAPQAVIIVGVECVGLATVALQIAAFWSLRSGIRQQEANYLRAELNLFVGAILALALEGTAGVLIALSSFRSIRFSLPRSELAYSSSASDLFRSLSLLAVALFFGVGMPLWLGRANPMVARGWRRWLLLGYERLGVSPGLELLVAFMLGFAFIGSLGIAQKVGYATAEHQREFIVAHKGGAAYVVLQLTDDDAVVAPFVRATRQLLPEFRVLRLKDTDVVVLATEHLGELSVTNR